MNATRMMLAGMLATVAFASVPAMNVVENALAEDVACVTVHGLPPSIQNRHCTNVIIGVGAIEQACRTLPCEDTVYNPVTQEPVVSYDVYA